jgi:hypothetical protein
VKVGLCLPDSNRKISIRDAFVSPKLTRRSTALLQAFDPLAETGNLSIFPGSFGITGAFPGYHNPAARVLLDPRMHNLLWV